MSSTHMIASVVLGTLLIAPLSAMAEESAPGNTGDGAPVPTLYTEQPKPGTVMLRQMERKATGTRMMASGTRPIPAKVEKRIEDREERAEQLRANCVLPDGTVASRTDCATFRKERREEVRERVAERRGEMLRALSGVLVGRLTAAIERETRLADRIHARILKLQEKGIVTTDAEAKLAIAKTKITDATSAVARAKTEIEKAVTVANATTSPAGVRDAGKTVRDEMTKAKEALMAAQKALVEALMSLKANTKATTTPEYVPAQ